MSESRNALVLEPDASAASVARRHARSLLPEDLDPESVEEVCLVVSELVTNAVLHAGTSVRLAVVAEIGSDRIRIEVSDESALGVAPRPYSEESGTGRGLILVDALAHRWGVDLTGSNTGKTVWAEFGGATPESPGAPPAGSDGQSSSDWAPPAPALSEVERIPEGLIPVHLRSLPVRVYVDAAEHSDELQREFALILERDPSEGSEPPGRLLAIIQEFHGQLGSFGDGARQALERAVVERQREVDLVYPLPAEIGPIADRLAQLFDAADSYCRTGELLTLATPPGARAFRRWLFDQFRDQVNGAAPVSWPDWKSVHAPDL